MLNKLFFPNKKFNFIILMSKYLLKIAMFMSKYLLKITMFMSKYLLKI